jgi:hypothetical protein
MTGAFEDDILEGKVFEGDVFEGAAIGCALLFECD